MSVRTASFYFDFISHNAYLAWAALPRLAERFDVHFEPVPVVFGALLKAHGQLGPAEVRPKAVWMLRDVARKALLAGIPLAPPHSHPFNPLLSLRVASLEQTPEARRQVVDALFAATWARSLDVSDADVVAGVLDEAGFDGAALLERAGTPECKAALRAQTDAALDRSVFGVPSVCVDGALFWGFDDLPHLERFLAGQDPLAGVDFEPWERVQPSIQRKR